MTSLENIPKIYKCENCCKQFDVIIHKYHKESKEIERLSGWHGRDLSAIFYSGNCVKCWEKINGREISGGLIGM